MVRSRRKHLGLALFVGAWFIVVFTIDSCGVRAVLAGEQCPLGTVLSFAEIRFRFAGEGCLCLFESGSQCHLTGSELGQRRSPHSFLLPTEHITLSRL